MDESVFPLAPYLTRGWFKVGSHPYIRYEHKRNEKQNILAVMNSKHFVYHFSEENFNSQVFKDFVINLIRVFNKLVLVMDNVGYHRSTEMQIFYRENEQFLHTEFLPSYSPELNPIEISWREAKKWLATKCCKNREEIGEELRSVFNNGMVMVPIYDYLLP